MKVEWALIAEGVTVDARGALAAVGLSQSVLATSVLPITVKRAVILLLTGPSDEFAPGRTVKFSFQVIAPSGEILSEHKGNIPMAANNFPELPTGITISAETGFTIKEYGRHLLEITAEPTGHSEMTSKLEFYVVQPQGDGVSNPSSMPESTVTHAPTPGL
jgi:hypothetical protein